MYQAEELIKRLRPLIGKRADEFWYSYLASDEEEKRLIVQSLENIHSQLVDDYQDEKIVLAPPHKSEQLHGDYPAGIVYYADQPLYPFSFLEKELIQHIGVFGRTGSGKSHFVKSLLLTHLLQNKPLLLFDWKNTYKDLIGFDICFAEPGSDNLPFFFNPLDPKGISKQHQRTYLRQIVELFIDSYLEDLKLLTVHGVESLLIRAVDALLGANKVPTFQQIYDWILNLQGRMREADWKGTALNLLYKLISSPLGNVVQQSCDINSLVQQQLVIELSNIGSSKDKSFFIRSLLLRLYYHFQELGPSKRMRLFLVIEEAHNILLKKGTGYETIVELMLRQVREFGVGICVVDQHPSLMSLPALGTYCTVAFNLRLEQDRRAMASALNLDRTEYLGKLPSRFAIVKIQDRYLLPFLIQSFDIDPRREHIGEGALYRSSRQKKGQRILNLLLIKQAIPPLSPSQISPKKQTKALDGNEVIPNLLGGFEPPRITVGISSQNTSFNREVIPLIPIEKQVIPKQGEVIPVVPQINTKRDNKLNWEEKFLIHICQFPFMGTAERYRLLGLSKSKGQRYRNSLIKKNWIVLEPVSTTRGRLKLSVPTNRAFDFLKERELRPYDSHKLGGYLHVYWKNRLRERFKQMGLSVELEVNIGGKQAVDLAVYNASMCVVVEIETGTNTYEKIISNIKKCLAHRISKIVSLILDNDKFHIVRERLGKTNDRVVLLSDGSECEQMITDFFRDSISPRTI